MNWRIEFCLVALLVGLLSGCQSDEVVEKKVIRPVRYQEVGSVATGTERSFSGTAATEKIINLSFRSGGIITKFDIKLGVEVKTGQLLAQLDNVQARLAYEQETSALSSAASEMNTAKLNLERSRSLYEKGSDSLSDYEAAKNSFRTAEARHKSAERSVEIQAEQIRYGYLYAPADGVISSVTAEINENVQAGTNVAVLNAGSEMQISVGLPESVINNVAVGMAAEITFGSLPGETFSGTVTEVSPATSGNSGTYPILVRVDNPTRAIRAGMAADVSFRFRGANAGADQLVVPAHAVGEDGEGRFVFVLTRKDGALAIASKKYIRVGTLSSIGFEVLEGLEAGELIATAGLHTLLNGQDVRLGS